MGIKRIIFGAATAAAVGLTAFALSAANIIAVAAGHVSPLVYMHS